MEKIFKLGVDGNNKYKIPRDLQGNEEIIEQQLQLLEKISPRDSSTRNKKENPQGFSKNAEKRESSPKASTSKGSESNLAKKQKITRNIKDYIPVVVEKGQMSKKLEAAAPYNFFLTAITDSKRTHAEPLTITMQGNFFLSYYLQVITSVIKNCVFNGFKTLTKKFVYLVISTTTFAGVNR